MIGVVIVLMILCMIIFAVALAYATGDEKMTDGQAITILITVALLMGLCWLAGIVTSEPKYFYEGMRVEKDDIDFSEFTMTYDEVKNCYYLEKKEK